MSKPLTTALNTVLACVLISACAPDAVTTTTTTPPPPPPAGPDLVVRKLDILAPAGPIGAGTTATLAFVARNAAGDTLKGAAITWYSSDPTIASITKAGVMTGVNVGTVTMIADAGSVAASVSIRINASPPGPVDPTGPTATRIVISGAPLQLGQSATFVAVAYDSRGAVVPGFTFMWTSSNPSVVTVTPDGVVRAIANGTVTIAATGGGITASTTVSVAVTVAPQSATALVFDHSLNLYSGDWEYSASLAPGQTMQLTAMLKTSQGQLLSPQPTLTWQSGHPDVATVNASGIVTALGIGRSDIVVTYGGLTATFSIDVAPISGTATLRLVHAVGETGAISFVSAALTPPLLSFGESRELSVPAGMLQMALSGVVTDPGHNNPVYSSFTGPLNSGRHYTFVAAGSGLYAGALFPLIDDHPPLLSGQAFVRIVMAGTYAANYYGNNIYFLDTAAPITASGIVACYFDGPTATGWRMQTPGPFDIVIADAGFFTYATQVTVPDVEAARFAVNPAPGKATTYVITGSTRATLRILTIEDP